jgi:hypothetical protein
MPVQAPRGLKKMKPALKIIELNKMEVKLKILKDGTDCDLAWRGGWIAQGTG